MDTKYQTLEIFEIKIFKKRKILNVTSTTKSEIFSAWRKRIVKKKITIKKIMLVNFEIKIILNKILKYTYFYIVKARNGPHQLPSGLYFKIICELGTLNFY